MDSLLQDVRCALRALRKSPGFTMLTVATLSLGIGAPTVVFSIVNGVVLTPLPYPHADELVTIYDHLPDGENIALSYLNFLDLQQQTTSFTGVAGYRQEDFNLTGTEMPERVPGEMVSAQFFDVLGVKPVVGRLFAASEDRLGAAPVAVLHEGFWRRKFGGAVDVIGRTLTLDGVDYAIIGVVPATLQFDRGNDLFVPLGQWSDLPFRDRKIRIGLHAVARLRRTATVAQASADLDVVARRLAAAYPDANRDRRFTAVPLKVDVAGRVAPLLGRLLGAVVFVLLIACANVANLVLVRTAGRDHELAIRAALGASRRRIVRPVLTETVLVAVAGGGVGALLAMWVTPLFLHVLPATLPRADDVAVDAHVLLFTIAASAVAAALCGIVPTLNVVRSDVNEALKAGGRGHAGGSHRAQGVLVVLEMALAVVLLIGAGLMIRTLANLADVQPGFNPQQVLTFKLAIPPALSQRPEDLRAYLQQLPNRLDEVPGVEASSAFVGALPLSGNVGVFTFWLAGQPRPANDSDLDPVLWYEVQPDYLRVMQIPLRQGRWLTAQDTEQTCCALVVDEAFVARYLRGQNPIGQRVNLGFGFPQAQIVGVVGHVKHWGLDADETASILPQAYFPLLQIPAAHLPTMARSLTVLARTRPADRGANAAIRRAIAHMNGTQVMYGEQPLEDVVAHSLAPRRIAMWLLGAFAGLALMLAAVGIYGVMASVVGQRTREFGIRTALGADAAAVTRLVLTEGFRLAGIGVVFGVVAALGLTRLLANWFYGVSAADPISFASVALLLTVVATAACLIPARRAARVDPMIALRAE